MAQSTGHDIVCGNRHDRLDNLHMELCTMLEVSNITAMQIEMVVRWHDHELDNPHLGFLGIACHQCGLNFQLWHQEDLARDPNADDEIIARTKRTIDQMNQHRNDWIERMDDWIASELRERGVRPSANVPLNTETPGSVIDRLAILALRIYHLEEQTRREDVTDEHLSSTYAKLAVCQEQHQDLSQALSDLLQDIATGRKQHKKYCQFKMYNDPTLNPHLYRSHSAQAHQLQGPITSAAEGGVSTKG